MVNSQRAVGIIVGPTAAGKSAIAMFLAQEFGQSIISADSRQIYRKFDVGTAKPTLDEMRSVRHFGVDIIDATERYSAHAWAADAHAWMAEAERAGTPAMIVGGTGFYIRSLVEPLAESPEFDASRRKQLELWFEGQDTETLRRWCARLDAGRAHLGRTQLLRALETALLAGVRLGDAHKAQQQSREGLDAKPLSVRYLVVDPGPPLADRIKQRVHAMVEQGWPQEVRSLMETIPESAPGWLASGYGVMRQHVRGDVRLDQAIERIVIETRQYAKRQRTWFRHQLDEQLVTRISSIEPQAKDQAVAWFKALETSAS